MEETRGFLTGARRWLLLLGIVLITVGAGWLASGVGFDNSIEIWFLEDDPNLVAYHDFLERFGADEFAVISLEADNVFTPEMLAYVDRLTRDADQLPYAHRVQSLTNVKVFGGCRKKLSFTPFVEHLPETQADADALRRRAMEIELLKGTLMSADGKVAAVLIEMSPEANNVEKKQQFMSRLRALVPEGLPAGVTTRYAGSPALDDAFFRYSYEDMEVLLPGCILLVLVITLLLYRSLGAALLSLAVVMVAVVWTFGAMGLFGLKVNVITSLIMALILTVGVADTIHVLSEYRRCLGNGVDRRLAVSRTMRNLFIPCLFTSVTSALGLLSLLVSSLVPMREFALLAAFGVVSAFVLSFTLVPALLPLVRLKPEQAGGRTRVVDGLARWLARPTPARSRRVVLVAVLLVAVSFWGVTYLKVGINTLDYFREGDPVRTDIEAIDSLMGGSSAVEFVVHTAPGGLKEPEVLRRIDEFSRWLEESPGVSRVVSAVDLVKETNRVWHGGDGKHLTVPDSRARVAQFFLLMEGDDDFEALLQDDYSVGRVTARVNLSQVDEFVDSVDKVKQRLEAESGSVMTIAMTGFVKLMADMETYLLDSQIMSLSLAFLVITGLMILLLRSLRIGLFSMIPNFIPILMGMAFMVPAGFSLNSGTVMIGSVALGLIVDDTIHFLVRFGRAVKSGSSVDDSIAEAIQETGRPIVITSLVLAGGFLVMVLGRFAPNAHFGVVNAVVILCALAADLVLLPAALQLASGHVSKAAANREVLQ